MEIGIDNFPKRIYIKLKEEYKNELIEAINKIKLDSLSKKLGVSKTTIVEWKKRAEYIPLHNLKIILKLLGKENYKKFEKNIISYGTKKSKLYIKNPILPIKDSQKLREIVIHIMCDGCFSEDNGYAAYYNINEETKKEFINELKECFGKIDFEIYPDHVHFPTAIPLILKKYFKIDFNSKQCRVPKQFFGGNNKKLSAIIRAAIIDEGTIDGSNIRINSCNKEFLADLKNICNKIGYKCGIIWESNGPIFRFNILAESLKQLKEDIKKLPSKNKQKLIEMAEENQKREWKYRLPGETKKEIIKNLKKRPMKTIELIFKIGLPKTTIGSHIRRLIKEKIVAFKMKNNKRTYYIKDDKKAQEFLRYPLNFIKSEKIKNYGMSQLKVLKFLNQSSKKYNEIEKEFKFCKSATFKLISSLNNKGFIEKNKVGNWSITGHGKNILLLDETKARYMLYANVKLA